MTKDQERTGDIPDEERATAGGPARDENRHDQIVALMSDAVFIQQDGKIVFANPAAAELHGAADSEQLIGMDPDALIHPDERTRMLSRRQEVLNGKRVRPIARRGRRLDGSEFMGETLGSQITWDGVPAILVIVRDVTERETARQAVRESEARYRQLAELSPDGIMVHTDGVIVFANPGMAKILGARSPDELIGKHSIDLIVPEQREEVMPRRKKVGAGRIAAPAEARFLRFDGSETYVERQGSPIIWQGRQSMLILVRDINERRRTEQALRESEERLRSIADYSPSLIYLKDTDSRILNINKAYEKFYGVTQDEARGRQGQEWLGEIAERLIGRDRKVLSAGQPVETEFEITDADGVSHHMRSTKFPVLDHEGNVKGIGGISTDITAHKKAEQTLRESEKKYRDLIEGSLLAVQISNENGKYLFLNQALLDLFGYGSPDEVLHMRGSLIAPHHRERIINRGNHWWKTADTPDIYEYDGLRKDGTIVPIQVFARKIEWDGREAVQRTLIDLTDRKKAEQALRESEDQHRSLFEFVPEAILVTDYGKILFCNPAAIRLFGAEGPEHLIGMNQSELAHADDWPLLLARIDKGPGRAGTMSELQIRWIRLDGSEFQGEGSSAPFLWEGRPVRLVMIRDITDRRRAEDALRASEAQMRLVTDAIPVRVAYIDRGHRIRFANRPYAEWYEISQQDILGMHARDLRGNESFEKSLPYTDKTFAGEVTSNENERRLADGSQQYYHTTRVPDFGDDGEVRGYYVISVDMTEHHEREEQLRHAQKMEVIGQLTGGVAHDFNNLLAVNLGNLELMHERLQDSALKNLAQKSIHAALRGAELTQLLLSFSRKQTLAPKIVDIGDLVTDMTELMSRTLGETVQTEVVRGDGLLRCKADPGQLQNAILNLAINARDAMPEGGRLTIEIADVRLDESDAAAENEVAAGDYVLLAVSDTGCGMPREVAERAFEPFFTTKEVGEGSGLGLSMVYGFIKQSGGHVAIETEEGVGTTVKLYVPKAAETYEPVRQGRAEAAPVSNGERILVVEDDPHVRALFTTMLGGLGYDIVEAADGKEAIAALQRMAGLDLLFTDVVLPGGLSGADVAREATRRIPGIKVLFASGYADNVLVQDGRLEAGVQFINKPFKKTDLALKVRTVLDGAAA